MGMSKTRAKSQVDHEVGQDLVTGLITRPKPILVINDPVFVRDTTKEIEAMPGKDFLKPLQKKSFDGTGTFETGGGRFQGRATK